MKFSEILAAVGIPPKTLADARGPLDQSKTALTEVSAMFAAAGLDLDAMRATGADSLKAYLAGLDKSADVTRLVGEVTALTKKLTMSEADVLALSESLAHVTTAIGIEGCATAEEVKTKFAAHIAKQTTLALAKSGHPPAHVPAADVTPAGAAKTNAELHAEWKAMKAGPDRLAFFTQHEAAITAHERSL